MSYSLYIDDERIPKGEYDVVARSALEVVFNFGFKGCPEHISFDHDLGEDSDSGYAIAQLLVEIDIEAEGEFIPEDFTFNVHSANPIGAQNIQSYLDNYLRHKNDNKKDNN